MRSRGVRKTKGGTVLALVLSPEEREKRLLAELSQDPGPMPTTPLFGLPITDTYTPSWATAAAPPLSPKSFALGAARLGLVRKPSDVIGGNRSSYTPEVLAQIAEADAELARMNFAGAARRAKLPCTCESPKERSCESCVARDDILRSRGDWL